MGKVRQHVSERQVISERKRKATGKYRGDAVGGGVSVSVAHLVFVVVWIGLVPKECV